MQGSVERVLSSRSSKIRPVLQPPKVYPTPMSAKPTGHAAGRSPLRFEIKSAQLALVALLLKSPDWDAVSADLLQQFGAAGESPDFFEQEPVVLDFSALPRDAAWTDPASLLQALRACALVPTAFRGQPAAWTQACLDLGLVQAAADLGKGSAVADKPAAAAPREAAAPATLVIDKPIRSGQKIYARGGDLVVLAMVNQGAEIVADGNIHVYAPLRGKAMAGARGNAAARIFSLCLEPELISIAGVYRTSENPLPAEVAGKPAQVRLASEGGQDRLLIEPLKN